MLAQVIVDVPSQNTDQAFSYHVPEMYENLMQVGLRVTVPFGKGGRLVQGFVVGLGADSTLLTADLPALKDLASLMDAEPVLNEEMLALSREMQKTTYAFWITCLQTMLPNVLKADYEKFFVAGDTLTASEAALFAGAQELPFAEAEAKGLLSQLALLKKAGKVTISYRVLSRDQVKTQRYFSNNLTPDALQKTFQAQRKNALKRQQFLNYLQTLTESLPVSAAYALGFDATFLRQVEQLGWISFEEREVYRDPFKAHQFAQSQPLALTVEQQAAYTAINESREQKQAKTFLLEGVTGSGKTEVYLQVIQTALEKKQTALMLVPEIALTPQMVKRFKERFGTGVAVLHSALSSGERYDEWRKIQRKEATVVVGARSAIFAPLENLGVIIIDEEHETTYKQGENPRYHARDLALWRSRYHGCPLVLGSATPSLESRARAQKGVYHLLRLTKRPTAQSLPQVEVVDLREEFQQGNTSTFSSVLQRKITERLEKRQQTVLLLNRRGYSAFVLCRECGEVLQCPNCDISLTMHLDIKKMKCHYCGHEEGIPRECPHCHSKQMRYYGTGTQKVEEELQQLFPSARILRMDVDTTRKKGAHEKILAAFEAQEADILLGTQMIAKGLDYPNVTLVGVLNADTALNLPDFRSSEHTFQLLTQVAGRAGRGSEKGEVIIQTFNPDHYAIQLAQQQNYEAFYQKEMGIRRLSGYPPYYFTVQLTASHQEEKVACQTIFQFYRLLKEKLSPQAIFIGPSPKAILRINNQYYYQVLIKYKHEEQLAQLLHFIQEQTVTPQYRAVKIAIDVEPLQFI